MIVSELIEALQKMPQDAKVIMVDINDSPKWDREVRDVIYNYNPYRNLSDGNTVELDNWPAKDF
jgi:hypothetical protein